MNDHSQTADVEFTPQAAQTLVDWTQKLGNRLREIAMGIARQQHPACNARSQVISVELLPRAWVVFCDEMKSTQRVEHEPARVA